MIVLKSSPEVATMRVAGCIVAAVLEELRGMVRPGLVTTALNQRAEELTKKYSAIPAFKGYNGYPASVCVSVNEEVVHGIPGNRILKTGDIVGLDFGVIYKSFYGDSAITVAVGEISPEVNQLLNVTKEALDKGIAQAIPGNRLYDISKAIQSYVEEAGFSVVRDFVGHGIGRAMHESPQVPNFVGNDFNPKLKAGMTLAIEPMVNLGSFHVEVDPVDKWTVRTTDRKYSAHFEHTIAITESAPQILTLLEPGLLPGGGAQARVR